MAFTNRFSILQCINQSITICKHQIQNISCLAVSVMCTFSDVLVLSRRSELGVLLVQQCFQKTNQFVDDFKKSQNCQYVELFTIQCTFFYIGHFQTFYSICRFFFIYEV